LLQKVANWQPFAVTDGRLVAGQNAASSTVGAQALLKLMPWKWQRSSMLNLMSSITLTRFTPTAEVVSNILNWVCPECGGRMGARRGLSLNAGDDAERIGVTFGTWFGNAGVRLPSLDLDAARKCRFHGA
jgi:hypothetical protein